MLTAENAKALIDARAAEFDLAIIAESARWGDAKTLNTLHEEQLAQRRQFRPQLHRQSNPRRARPIARPAAGIPTAIHPIFTVNGLPSNGERLDDGDEVGMFATGSTTYTTIVPAGSTWKYLDNGSNQGTAWRAAGFNDSSWSSGPAELGYGDGDENTVVGFGPDSSNKYRTTYFRKTFNVRQCLRLSDTSTASETRRRGDRLLERSGDRPQQYAGGHGELR